MILRQIPMDQKKVLDLVRQLEAVLIDSESEYVDAFGASLYVAAVSANQMGMTKETFLKNCETIFDHDKVEQMKEMQ